jgi:hypothetical protein
MDPICGNVLSKIIPADLFQKNQIASLQSRELHRFGHLAWAMILLLE